MAKHIWQKGEVITAQKMNNLESNGPVIVDFYQPEGENLKTTLTFNE